MDSNVTVIDQLSAIEEDLRFKKKFWQFLPTEPAFSVAGGVRVQLGSCDFADETAEAFTVESIQLDGLPVLVREIIVDGVSTDISDKEIFLLISFQIQTQVLGLAVFHQL